MNVYQLKNGIYKVNSRQNPQSYYIVRHIKNEVRLCSCSYFKENGFVSCMHIDKVKRRITKGEKVHYRCKRCGFDEFSQDILRISTVYINEHGEIVKFDNDEKLDTSYPIRCRKCGQVVDDKFRNIVLEIY